MFKKTVPDKDYVPNFIPTGIRIGNLFLAVALISLGVYGIWKDELYLQFKRHSEVTLFGDALYVAMASFIFAAIYFLLEVIDHYDKRNNEHVYRRLKLIFRGFACMIFIAAIIINLKYVYPI